MATIAVDATYIFDSNPTGTATYSRRLIESLAKLDTPHRFLVCYRMSRFGRRREFLRPTAATESGKPRFSVRLFQEPLTFWLPWQADLFHSLAQRPPAFHFKHEVVTVHDIFPITGRDYSTAEFQRRFSALLREAMARAGRIVTVSKYTADQLVQYCDVGRERIRVIPSGVDVPEETIPREARWRERQSLVGEGKEMLLTVGALDVRKNVVNTLRALKFLPERYRLVLAGGKGYGSQAILNLIGSERLESRVSLLGYVTADRLLALYQAASVLVFPSLDEGFGFPVLEAMACGTPVVTSQTSSLPEVGGDAALYVDPRDPRDIAAKVVSAVEDSCLRQELIQKGLVRARQFPWSRTAEETLNVYNEMLQ